MQHDVVNVVDAASYHEAGHAVMSCRFGIVPDGVEIRPDGTGYVHNSRRQRNAHEVIGWSFADLTIRDYLRSAAAPGAARELETRLSRLFEADMMIALAGPVAERRVTKRRDIFLPGAGGANGDWNYVCRAFVAFRHREPTAVEIALLLNQTRNYLRRRNVSQSVELVAAELRRRGYLSADQLLEIVTLTNLPTQAATAPA